MPVLSERAWRLYRLKRGPFATESRVLRRPRQKQTHAYDSALAGKLTLKFTNGSSVRCDVKLERDSSKDTDD